MHSIIGCIACCNTGVSMGGQVEVSKFTTPTQAPMVVDSDSTMMYIISPTKYLAHRSKIMRTHALIRQCIMRAKFSTKIETLRRVFKLVKEYKFDDDYFNKRMINEY